MRWYLAYALSYRDIEEMMAERGFSVDPSTIHRWVIHYSPQLEVAFRRKKKHIDNRWRMNEPYLKVKAHWRYYYRVVDKQDQTIDFLLTAKRDTTLLFVFLKNAIEQHGKPSLVNTVQSGANKADLNQVNGDHHTRIQIRRCKYLNNILEQDHRRIKKLTRPMLSFKNVHVAQLTLAGIEVMAMIKKGKMMTPARNKQSPTELFYALVT